SELLRAGHGAHGYECEFELQAFRPFRATIQQAECARCEIDCLPRSEVPHSTARALGVVAKCRGVRQSCFVLRCELRSGDCNTRGAAAFQRGCDTTMHLHARRDALALIENV